MCGEKDKAKEMGATTKGSPPRMRGKAIEMKLAGTVHGITPAYAGKSICDKHINNKLRGKDAWRKLLIVAPGITPAYAGKRYMQ